VAIYTVGNVGAAVSFANDMATINGGSGASGLDQGLTRINQGTAVIGIVTSGSGPEVVVNVIGVTGNEIIGTTDIGHMTPEELAGYLDEDERKDFLEQLGAKPTYREPTDTGGGGGEGGGSGGGGGDCGRH
jgi:adenosine/AMP kinase